MLEVSTERTVDTNAGERTIRAHKRRLKDALDYGFAVSQEHAPEDRGTLQQTAVEPQWEGNTLSYKYTQPYAWPMEEGTQAFVPPAEPLLDWAERVVGDRGFGWYVQDMIAEEGLEGHHYAREGARAARSYLDSHDLGSYLDDEFR